MFSDGVAYTETDILKTVITGGTGTAAEHRLPGGRQDRDDRRLHRRLVRRLHAAALDRGLGRPPRRALVARLQRLRRHARGADLARLHGASRRATTAGTSRSRPDPIDYQPFFGNYANGGGDVSSSSDYSVEHVRHVHDAAHDPDRHRAPAATTRTSTRPARARQPAAIRRRRQLSGLTRSLGAARAARARGGLRSRSPRPGAEFIPGAAGDAPRWVLGPFGDGLRARGRDLRRPALRRVRRLPRRPRDGRAPARAPDLGRDRGPRRRSSRSPGRCCRSTSSATSPTRGSAPSTASTPTTRRPPTCPLDPAASRVDDWRFAVSVYGPAFTLASYPLGLVGVSAALWALKARLALSRARDLRV